MTRKSFNFEEARALIPRVREITASAHSRIQELSSEITRLGPGTARSRKLQEWINTVVQDWAAQIEATGALAKGVWTVDFDSGDGFFFCWTHDEEELSHFHSYDEGFPGRKPLTGTHKSGQPPALLN
jgi:hypothetical protein